MAILSTSVIARTQVVARSKRSTAVARQQALVKQINQRAQRFFKAFIKERIRTAAAVDREVIELLEDFLLAVEGLTEPQYTRHNLFFVMQIASDIEQELLFEDISLDVVMAWSRLHADVDLLAKMHGIKWSEVVITRELIATLASDVDTISKKVHTELLPFHLVSSPTSADLAVLLTNFRSSAQALDNRSADELHYRIAAVRNYARAINASLNNRVVSSALQRDWRRVTSRLEELVRLYNLDSIELFRPTSQPIAAQN